MKEKLLTALAVSVLLTIYGGLIVLVVLAVSVWTDVAELDLSIAYLQAAQEAVAAGDQEKAKEYIAKANHYAREGGMDVPAAEWEEPAE